MRTKLKILLGIFLLVFGINITLAKEIELVVQMGHSFFVSSVAFSPDGEYIVTGSWDRTAKLWDVATGKEIRTYKGHSNDVNSVDFSPDGRYIVTGSWDHTAKLWDVAMGKEIRTYKGHSHWVKSVDFSPDDRHIVTGSGDSTAKLWEVATGKEIRAFRGHSHWVNSVNFSPDSRHIVIGSDDDTAKLWDVAMGKEIRTYKGHSHWVKSVDFSPDGRHIVTGSDDSTAKLWDVATGKEIRTFKGHSDWVTSVDFSPDGLYLITGSMDATTKLWEVNSVRQLASLISIDTSDFIFITPDGFYTCSKNGYKGVAFRLGNKVFPFEQFDLRLNRPDIVLQRIGRAPKELIESYYKAYLKRLKRMNFTEEMLGDDFHLPEIEITSKSLPFTTANKMFNFKIKAEDSKYLLDRLNVHVNGVPIYGINGINLRDKKASNYEGDVNLELSNSRNKIQSSVLNEKGAESLKETFEITYVGETSKPDLYIIAIGVSEYEDSTYNLTYAAKDAEDLTKLLAGQSDRYKNKYTFKILNKDATKDNILAVKDKLMHSNVDDEVVLFIAGHGLLDDSLDYYFATTNIDFLNPAEKGLPYEAIEGLLDGIPARKKLLLMDTCHSGEVDKEEIELIVSDDKRQQNVRSRSFRNVVPVERKGKLGLSNSFQLMQELFANLSRGSGSIVISAASGVEFAYEDREWQNGVFTYCLVDGIKNKKADFNKDGKIHISELRDYIVENVTQLTSGGQTPTSRRENLEFDFRIY